MNFSEATHSAPERAAPYTVLAEGYETVMAHVDYRRWAGHVHDLMQSHAPAGWPMGPKYVLELGCGTGALARWLQPRGPYRYLATDRSEAMLAVARRRARAQELPIRFYPVDFTQVEKDLREEDRPFDAVLLLYDGLNYLLEEDQLRRLLGEVARVLRPGGLFLFDQSTPANSAEPAAFEDAGTFEQADGQIVQYRRESRYDPARHLHETVFELDTPAGRHTERHVQRAYAMGTVRELIAASPLTEEAAYENFSTEPATPESRRIHWMTQLRG